MLKSSLKTVSFTFTSIAGILTLSSSIEQKEHFILIISILVGLLIICLLYLIYYTRLKKKEELKESILLRVLIIVIIVLLTAATSKITTLTTSKKLKGPPEFNPERQITQETIDNYKDDAYGQFGIGYSYYTGFDKTTEPNYEEAFKWFESSAKYNNPLAIYYLGVMNYYGHGVKRSYVNAMSQFEKAASLDLAEAHTMLADMYHNGLGTQKDSIKYFRHTQIAAEAGNAVAQRNLGFYYLIQEKKDSAMHWMHQSAKQGFTDAQFLMAWFSIEKDLPEDKEDPKLSIYREGIKTSMKWANILAENDEAEGYYILGLLHSLGNRQEFNFPKSLDYYLKAANKGYTDAYLSLVHYYSSGETYPGLKTDLDVAIKWCNLAIEQGNEDTKEKAKEMLPPILERKKRQNGPKSKKPQHHYTDSTMYKLFFSDIKNYSRDNNFKKLSDF